MKNVLETASKIVYWVFVVFAVLTFLQGIWVGMFGMGMFGSGDKLPGILHSGAMCVVLFLLAYALAELSRLHSDFDQKEMLEGLANVASRISERARAAAQKENDKDKDKDKETEK